MSRDLLPERFHVKTRKCKDKNKAIVKMLLDFGINVHDERNRTESLNEYDRLFYGQHNLIVEGNSLRGGDENHDKLSLPDLLFAYGKMF